MSNQSLEQLQQVINFQLELLLSKERLIASSAVPGYKLENPQKQYQQDIRDNQTIQTQHTSTNGAQKIDTVNGATPSVFDLNATITEIITLIINFSNKEDSKIQEARMKYKNMQNGRVVDLFDIINQRLSTSKRNKEEMIKYIIRKSLKYYKQQLKLKEDRIHLIENGNGKLESDILTGLPFRKGSQIKTMNIQFLNTLFSCQDYVQCYELYLEKLQLLIEEDNEKKLKLFTWQILQTIDHKIENIGKLLSKINRMRRLPWTSTSLSQLKDLAQELRQKYHLPQQECRKQVKREDEIEYQD